MSNTPSQATHANNLSQMEENAIQEFSDLITSRMADGKAQGYGDWEKVELLPDHKLRCLLVKALREADWGSVGAYAMMAHQRGLKVVDPASGLTALPSAVLVSDELDRDFLNVWTRDTGCNNININIEKEIGDATKHD